jgi:transcriptional regulator with XRE-family HTH domain
MTGLVPVRRRLLGSALRQYREGLGYNLQEAAAILDCDRSKISRIETGQRGIRAKELRELLTEYGVPPTEQEALLAVAHRGRESGWWLDYRDVLSAAAQDYLIMEIAAAEILAYEPNHVPDLLQTVDYARAVADADANAVSDEQRAHAVEVKLNRQRIALSAPARRLEFVITEGALRQAVGGPEVMRAQLARLSRLAESGAAPGFPDTNTASAAVAGGRMPARVIIRVLPFAAGAHAAAGSGSMTVLRFAEASQLGIVHLGGLLGGASLEERVDVSRYLRTFGQLSVAALAPAESARLIRVIGRGRR